MAAAAINAGPDEWFMAGAGTSEAPGRFIRLVRELWVGSHAIPGLPPGCDWRTYGLQGIRRLRLSRVDAAEAIASLQLLPSATGLDVCVAILEHPAARPLTRLGLGRLELAGARSASLVATRCAMELEELSLAANRLDAKSAAAILGWKPAQTLRRLDLRNNDLSGGDSSVLSQLRQLPRLAHLDLTENPLGSDGLDGSLPEGERLEALHLDRCWLDDESLIALARPMPALRHLSLAGNHISERGLATLARAPWLHQLERLELRDNDVTDEGPSDLAVTGLRPGVLAAS